MQQIAAGEAEEGSWLHFLSLAELLASLFYCRFFHMEGYTIATSDANGFSFSHS